MNLIEEYIIGITNIYAITYPEQILEIYNSHQNEKIRLEDICVYLNNDDSVLDENFIIPHDGMFVMEWLLNDYELEKLLIKKGDKPFYFPSREDVKNYSDMHHVAKNEHYDDLTNLFESLFKDQAHEPIDNYVFECFMNFIMYDDLDFMLYNLERMRVPFHKLEDISQLIKLLINLNNESRKYSNNGFTPLELHEDYDDVGYLSPLLSSFYYVDHGSVKKLNPGRNEKCPCGSGKKYKQCCKNVI